jgi:hypothetical protein
LVGFSSPSVVFSMISPSTSASGSSRLSLQVQDIHAPALPCSVHEPSVFENNR